MQHKIKYDWRDAPYAKYCTRSMLTNHEPCQLPQADNEDSKEQMTITNQSQQ